MSKKVTKKTETTNGAPRTKPSRARTKAAAPEASTTRAAREASEASSPTEEQIRARAYELFRIGANPRDPVADWFQAEQELRGGAEASL
jgi:Protein of unknown function (DUF2934)